MEASNIPVSVGLFCIVLLRLFNHVSVYVASLKKFLVLILPNFPNEFVFHSPVLYISNDCSHHLRNISTQRTDNPYTLSNHSVLDNLLFLILSCSFSTNCSYTSSFCATSGLFLTALNTDAPSISPSESTYDDMSPNTVSVIAHTAFLAAIRKSPL